MNVYRTKLHPKDPAPTYSPTLALAKAAATADGHRRTFELTRVDLLDVDVSKDGIVWLLSGGILSNKLRTWRVSPRGALIEITKGE